MKLTHWWYRRVCFVLGALLIFCWQSVAQNPGAFPPPRPTTGSGPYKAVMEMDAGLPDHTIYRPEDLSALKGVNLPVVVWGNGACVDVGNAFSNFLTDISSYGYLVIALGPIVQGDTAAPAQRPQVPAAPPKAPADTTELPRNLPPAATHPSQMLDAIRWALAENARAGSKYQKHLDSSKMAVMGQSCGGVQAIEVAADRRVTTAVIWNSGLFAKPTNMGGGKTLGKRDLESIHVPMAYISGDAQDIAFNNANADFEYLTKIPVFRAYERGVGHGGTYREPNGGEFSGIAVAWLNWQLKGDQKAAHMFESPECGLCVNPKWVVRTKNLK
jgi:dienelactone hydrolase